MSKVMFYLHTEVGRGKEMGMGNAHLYVPSARHCDGGGLDGGVGLAEIGDAAIGIERVLVGVTAACDAVVRADEG